MHTHIYTHRHTHTHTHSHNHIHIHIDMRIFILISIYIQSNYTSTFFSLAYRGIIHKKSCIHHANINHTHAAQHTTSHISCTYYCTTFPLHLFKTHPLQRDRKIHHFLQRSHGACSALAILHKTHKSFPNVGEVFKTAVLFLFTFDLEKIKYS